MDKVIHPLDNWTQVDRFSHSLNKRGHIFQLMKPKLETIGRSSSQEINDKTLLFRTTKKEKQIGIFGLKPIHSQNIGNG